MTDEHSELERCKQENARLKELVVQLSELVLRDVVKRSEDLNSRESLAQRGLPLSGQGAGSALVSIGDGAGL